MFLTDTEIADLTQRRRRNAQARVLAFMGIEHKRRPDDAAPLQAQAGARRAAERARVAVQ